MLTHFQLFLYENVYKTFQQRSFSIAQWVKNLPAMQETQEMWIWSLGGNDPMEEEMGTHSSILAWRISWTEETAGYSPWGYKEADKTEWLNITKKRRFLSVKNLFLIDLFLIGGWLLYNIVLVSALHQHESAIAYICLQGYIFMKPFVQILLINMGTVKYDPSYKKSLLHVHLSTSNNLFLYSCYFILSLGLCSNFTGNTLCLPFSLLLGLPFLSFNWQHRALPYWRQSLLLFCRPAQSLSSVWLIASLWTVAHEAPLSMGFSRQESWSGLPCPPPGNLPDAGIKAMFLMSPASPSRFFTTSTICEALAPLLVLSKYFFFFFIEVGFREWC